MYFRHSKYRHDIGLVSLLNNEGYLVSRGIHYSINRQPGTRLGDAKSRRVASTLHSPARVKLSKKTHHQIYQKTPQRISASFYDSVMTIASTTSFIPFKSRYSLGPKSCFGAPGRLSHTIPPLFLHSQCWLVGNHF
jgi:hypothetical protein